MADYKCIQSGYCKLFGNNFWEGQEISESVYRQLPPEDKLRFTPVFRQIRTEDRPPIESYNPSIHEDSGYPTSYNIDTNDSSDSSSFDFGGGDTGGGGASGDW